MRNEKSRKDWCKLPYALILDENLTLADAVVYAVLNDISFGGVSTTTLPELVVKTGVPLRTLHRCLKRLKDEGYIVSTKSDGRRLAIVVEQVVSTPSDKRKPGIEYSPPITETSGTETPTPVSGAGTESELDSYEKILVDMLSKKMAGISYDKVLEKYKELKDDARIRVRDQSKLLAYLSTVIRNYVFKRDNSDGVDDTLANEYNKLWNAF